MRTVRWAAQGICQCGFPNDDYSWKLLEQEGASVAISLLRAPGRRPSLQRGPLAGQKA